MTLQNIILIAVFVKKPFINEFKRGYNEAEFAKLNSGFSRLFTQGVEITPSLSHDFGVFLCLPYYGVRKLGGLLSCRFPWVRSANPTFGRLHVFSRTGSGSYKPKENTMDNCIQNLPYSVNTHQKQILNKILGRKRFNRDALEALNNHGFISQIQVCLVSEGWTLNLLTIDQQTASLKTLDGSKTKVFKSLDTVNEFLSDLGLTCFVVTSKIQEVNHV